MLLFFTTPLFLVNLQMKETCLHLMALQLLQLLQLQVTANYRTHSTEKSESIEMGFSDSEHDRYKLGWEVGYYSTFGIKYLESEAEEDATWEESTTEQISGEL
jgi:hypothetical protein